MKRLVILFTVVTVFWHSYGEYSPVDVNVGVLLDEAAHPTRIACLNMAIADLYWTHPNYTTRIVFHWRNSTRKAVPAAAKAVDLIARAGVQAIIGPPTSMQAPFVISLGEAAQIPIITFSATSPALTSTRSQYFFRATQNDYTQTRAISALMQAFGWRQAVPIYVDNEYGQGILPHLADALVDIDASIPYRCVIAASATDDQIRAELLTLMSMSTRVFIVHMAPDLGGKIFQMAKSLGMMSKGYAWIVTNGLTDALRFLNSSVIDSMEGVLGVRTFVNDSELRGLENRLREKYPSFLSPKLKVYDLWGYDAAMALAVAVEKVGSKHFKNITTTKSSLDIEHLPVSPNGPLLLDALSNVSFKGLMGDFKFVNGEIPPATYEILNINGGGWRTIGFWTGVSGLRKELPLNYSNETSLQTIIWPGDPKSIPKGWVLPTEGKKLKIVVPVKQNDNGFVITSTDPKTNESSVSGVSIDIFKKVLQKLGYPLPHEYILHALPNGSKAGSYNNMVMEVAQKKYDAAVGDITIIDTRSEYVDFSMPYIVSGVSIVVRASYERNPTPKIFFAPFSKSLWMAVLLSFPFIALVIWFLERNVSSHLSGTVAQGIRRPQWYSYLTMIYTHGVNIESNYTRIVVVVWSFVVMILIQSYTASLASLLTVQVLNPISMDVNELIIHNNRVGYQTSSFLPEKLIQLGFKKSNLVPYESFDQCHQFFQDGDIVAAIDETPYIHLFQSKYCNQYATKRAFETGGFGFVFQKGSPLVNDVSRAVLQVVTGVYSTKSNGSGSIFEKNGLGRWDNCSESSVTLNSSTIDFPSFYPFFSLVVGTALLAVFISFSLHKFHSFRTTLNRTTHVQPTNPDFDPYTEPSRYCYFHHKFN